MTSFGPSLPDGRAGSIGSGDWPKTAGKKPASIVSRPSGVASVSPLPAIVIFFARVPPEIEASDGPFAAAAAGSRSPRPSAASTSIERFIAAPFVVAADTPLPTDGFRSATVSDTGGMAGLGAAGRGVKIGTLTKPAVY